MNRICCSFLLVYMAGCTSPNNYGNVDAETIAEIEALDAFVSRHGLNVNSVTAWNFLNQGNHYRNLVLVRVTEQRLRIDESPQAYPRQNNMEAQVVRVYKGSLPDMTISLVTAHEEIPETMAVPIGRQFFLFFDEKMAAGTIRIETGAMWDYNKDLATLITEWPPQESN